MRQGILDGLSMPLSHPIDLLFQIAFAVLPIVPGAHAEAAARTILSDEAYDLYQSRFSPDGKWIVFEALPVRNDEPASVSAIFVSPAAGQTWVRVTDGTLGR